jgi:hypothetical protein
MRLKTNVVFSSLISLVIVTISTAQHKSRPVKQPAEVVKAYRVCEQFQKALSHNFDFHEAFEATFTPKRARQRAIAIKDGEFGNIDFSNVEDQTLIRIKYRRILLSSRRLYSDTRRWSDENSRN